MRAYIAVARPDHWIKNLFAIPGAFLGWFLSSGQTQSDWQIRLLLAFVAMVVASSANYTINEWLDRKTDAHHPHKRNRPAVKGEVTRTGIFVQYTVLTVLSLVLAWLVSPLMLALLATFLILGLIYNVPPIRAKDRTYVDVLVEAANNPVRFSIGWVAVSELIIPSSALISYWMGGAFLMAMKRFAERRTLEESGINLGEYRQSLANYGETSLLLFSMFCALVSTALFGIFLVRYDLTLVLVVPLLAALFVYYMYLALKPNSPVQHPEQLWRERGLLLLAVVTLVAAAVIVTLPFRLDF